MPLQPASREPLLRNNELCVAAIEADLNIGLWGERRVAHGAGSIAIKADFSGDGREGSRLALGTDHMTLQKLIDLVEKSTIILSSIQPQQKMCKPPYFWTE